MRWPTRRLYGVVNGFSSPVGKGARTGNLEGIRFVSLCLAGWWNAIRLQGATIASRPFEGPYAVRVSLNALSNESSGSVGKQPNWMLGF